MVIAKPLLVIGLVKYWKEKLSIYCNSVWILIIIVISVVHLNPEWSMSIMKRSAKKSVLMLWKISWVQEFQSLWLSIPTLDRKIMKMRKNRKMQESSEDC